MVPNTIEVNQEYFAEYDPNVPGEVPDLDPQYYPVVERMCIQAGYLRFPDCYVEVIPGTLGVRVWPCSE